MYERVPTSDLETVLNYLRHQVREVEAELARRRAPTVQQPAPPPPLTRMPRREPPRWYAQPSRAGGTTVLHTAECGMHIGGREVGVAEADRMMRDGRATMLCECTRSRHL